MHMNSVCCDSKGKCAVWCNQQHVIVMPSRTVRSLEHQCFAAGLRLQVVVMTNAEVRVDVLLQQKMPVGYVLNQE